MGIVEVSLMASTIAVPSLLGLLWKFDNRLHTAEFKLAALEQKLLQENTNLATAINTLTQSVERRSVQRHGEWPKPLTRRPWQDSDPPFDRID